MLQYGRMAARAGTQQLRLQLRPPDWHRGRPPPRHLDARDVDGPVGWLPIGRGLGGVRGHRGAAAVECMRRAGRTKSGVRTYCTGNEGHGNASHLSRLRPSGASSEDTAAEHYEARCDEGC